MTDPKPIKLPKPQATEPMTGPPAATPSVTPASTTAADEHHGRGGMYTVINGQRTLVERTRADHETSAADTTQSATRVNPAITE